MTDLTRRDFARASALTTGLTLAPSAQAATLVAQHGRLQVRGNRVVDAHGTPITLRGASLFWSQWEPQFYNRSAIAWLKRDWHVSAIRAAIAAKSGGFDKDPVGQLRLARAAIDAAIELGLYVIVDWHAHDPLPDNAIRFFSEIARRYRGVPNLIYEPYNEPLPKYGWADVLKPYHAQVIGAIRAIDPDAFVVAGTRSWSQDVDEAAADPLPFANVAYTLHYYAATHKQALRDKAERALAQGVALFVTEYGVTNANGNTPVSVEESQRWWDWCEANGVSYLSWSICDKEEASAALVPGASPLGGWRPDQLTLSGRIIRAQIRSRQ